MPAFDFCSNLKKTAKVALMVLCSTLFLIWLNQTSLERFWQQQYHRPAPWSGLSHYYAWQVGGQLRDGVFIAVESYRDYLQVNHPDNQAKPIVQTSAPEQLPEGFAVGLHFFNGYTRPATQLTQRFPQLLERKQAMGGLPYPSVTDISDAALEALKPIVPKTEITLSPEDKVLFAGDSMMQGVAPLLKRQLQTNYNISSIDLSKQSTGLAYPRFFNWPQTIATRLASDKSIKLLVVFLGPNDPWDMPPDGGGRYLKFASEAWESTYRTRIASIIENARQNNVTVIWVGPPNMRKPKLSEGMAYLDKLYREEAEKMGEIYLSVNDMFKYEKDIYSDYMGDGSSRVKLRAGDGIHFSLKGQQIIAQHVFSRIHLQEEIKEDDAVDDVKDKNTVIANETISAHP
ncbi:SGNH/GDSL hydrolase family protein [Proteus vulgaris]|uniref:SGNH/GDSL hydrolase family protein n=1 Tax=Proteus vulgaris TaxID=585 RepID=UPI0032DA3ED5